MIKAKKPQAGEWWEYKDNTKCRRYIIGNNHKGHPVGVSECGEYEVFDEQGNMRVEFWKHLPGCDSFEWQPPKWPRYVVKDYWENTAYLRFDAENEYVAIAINGSDITRTGWIASFSFTSMKDNEVTEAEALARVKPPVPEIPGDGYRLVEIGETIHEGDEWMNDDSWVSAKCVGQTLRNHTPLRRKVTPAAPAESPDDWVTQDRVPVRSGVDQVRWSAWDESNWQVATGTGWGSRKHGYINWHGEVLHARCRRKDLPPAKPERTGVTIHVDHRGVFNLLGVGRELRHDGTGFYLV